MFRKPKLREFCKEGLHLVAQLPPDLSQSKAVQLLKGSSSYELFRLIPNSRLKYPKGNLWSARNFKESIGRNTTENIRQYVRRGYHVY